MVFVYFIRLVDIKLLSLMYIRIRIRARPGLYAVLCAIDPGAACYLGPVVQ